MTRPMYVMTVTEEEWSYLRKHVDRSKRAPEGLDFALRSAIRAQQNDQDCITERRERAAAARAASQTV